MRFLSLFSGIEAASQAWLQLGWQCVGVAEVDPFPCAVLRHHYPDVPNLGDVTQITQAQVEALGRVDVVVGGFPCQDLSVAGKRKGLRHADGSVTRSGLFFDAMRIVRWARPRWLLLENVPGLFSSHQGRDFAAVVGEVLGVSFDPPSGGWENSGVAVSDRGLLEWATLDAQFFGVPQRRRRVFALADFGDWTRRPPVLFERESLSGHPAPRREAGQVAPTVPARRTAGGGLGTDFDCDGGLIARQWPADVAPTLNAAFGDKQGLEDQHALGGEGLFVPSPVFEEPIYFQDDATPKYGSTVGALRRDAGGFGACVAHAFDARQADVLQYGDKTGPLDTDGSSIGVMTLAFDTTQITSPANGSNPKPGDPCHPLASTAHAPAVAFSAKDYGADAGDIAPTLRAGGHAGSHANGGVMPAVAFTQNQRDEVRSLEVAGALPAEPGMKQQTYLAVTHETLYSKGINHASTQETYAATLLRALREEVGAEAFTQWGLGILDSLLPAEVLRSRLHGCGVRLATFSRRWLVYHALSRQEAHSEGLVLAMREAECEGRASQGWRPPKQLARELGAYLSELSQPGAQAARFMRDLWQASEGLGLLRQALSAVQEVGRPARLQGEPAHAALQVRRLTVEECEFLQGFPRGYTAIPYRGKPAADGPRYKALGNSMAVPVMHWIGKRIQMVEEL